MEVTNIINNTEIAIPPYTLCVQVDPYTFFSGATNSTTNTSANPYSTATEIFFNESMQDGVLVIDEKRQWPMETYVVIWEYLALIYETESLRNSPREAEILTQQADWRVSKEQLVGALGGALGLWLGLDFVVLIQFVINPIVEETVWPSTLTFIAMNYIAILQTAETNITSTGPEISDSRYSINYTLDDIFGQF
uniref:Uncharacterized protein n=1 Tax=Plectus sambesii TaxID=2011161 RepID=A0A914UTW9_9BILA